MKKKMFWLSLFVLTTSAVVVSFDLDVLNIRSAIDHEIINAFYRSVGAEYPQDTHDQVQVVIIDQRTLEELNLPYPPPYSLLGTLISRIRQSGPQAIVVTITYPDERDDPMLSLLLAILENSRRVDVPIIFTGAFSVDPQNGIRSELRDLIEDTENFILAHGRDELPTNMLHPIQVGAENTALSPAASAFAALYGDYQSFLQRPSMEIWWPDTHTTNRTLDVSYLWQFLTFERLHMGINYENLYHNTVMATEVVGMESEDWLRENFRDKIVFIGQNIIGVDSQFATPFFQRIPYVYFEAMALDNMITLRDGVIGIENRSIFWSLILLALAWILILVYFLGCFCLEACTKERLTQFKIIFVMYHFIFHMIVYALTFLFIRYLFLSCGISPGHSLSFLNFITLSLFISGGLWNMWLLFKHKRVLA